jgi:predicted XRE-type DNA-binding protein
VYQSDGNIFANLGLPDPESHFLKTQLVAELHLLTRARKLTQSTAGELMGISQPEVSRFFKGNFRKYSIDRLLSFLTAFDCDVDIISRSQTDKEGRGQMKFSLLLGKAVD